MFLVLLASVATMLSAQSAGTASSEVRVSTAQAGNQRQRYADWGGQGEAVVLLLALSQRPARWALISRLLTSSPFWMP